MTPPPSAHHAPSPSIPASLISPAHAPISSSVQRIFPAPAPSPTQGLTSLIIFQQQIRKICLLCNLFAYVKP